MTRKSILKNFSKSMIKNLMMSFEEIEKLEPLKEKIETQYEFKNNIFNKSINIKKNDFKEFFSRIEIESIIEKDEDFNDIIDILSGYPNMKIFSERGLDAKILLHSFVENYVYYTKNFKYKDSNFEYIFKSFVTFLDSESLQVHYFVPLFRLSFPSGYNQKDLGDLKLSKISPKEFKIIKESLVGTSSTPGYLRKLSHILEITIPFENNPEQEDSVANKKFDTFLKIAHLFFEADVKIGPIYKNYTYWMNNSSKILNIHDIHLSSKNVKLTSVSSRKLKNFYCKYQNIDLENKDWSFIQVAIDRFSSSILRINPVDKIVDLNVSLECLFSSAGETSLKISNRTAMMMGPDENAQEQCWNFIKNTYRLRNDILHGRKGSDYDISADVKELERIIRKSIRKFLNLANNLSKDELKIQGELTDGRKIRDYILDQLDSGLINRIKLENFEKKISGPFD